MHGVLHILVGIDLLGEVERATPVNNSDCDFGNCHYLLSFLKWRYKYSNPLFPILTNTWTITHVVLVAAACKFPGEQLQMLLYLLGVESW